MLGFAFEEVIDKSKKTYEALEELKEKINDWIVWFDEEKYLPYNLQLTTYNFNLSAVYWISIFYEKAKTLEEYFNKSKTKQQQNDAIINSLEDLYTQTEIAKYLELSNSAISKIGLESYKSRNSIHGT